MSATDDRSPLRFEANGLCLDPGVRLLEASAGTGKTFALAHLVLRLVSESELRLSQILVVTFTEAAAAELRDRIGRRLQAGLAALENPATATASTDATADAVLEAWRQRCAQQDDAGRDRLRVQLLLALEELPAADITTIHGFCRRSLMREALAAGRAPQLQLEDPDDPGLSEVVHAYWQQQVLDLPPHLLRGLRRCGFDPAGLESLLRSLDADPSLQLEPLPADLPLEVPLAEGLARFWISRWQGFLQHWNRSGRALQEDLHAEAARWKEQGVGNTKPYLPTATKDRCAALDAWIASQPPEGDYTATLAQDLLSEYYHPGSFCRVARRAEGLSDAVVRLPQPALMQAVAAVVDGPIEAALLHALHQGRRELEQRRRRRGVSTFSMLLRDLDPGPDPDRPAPLLQAVAGRYRAALIDEFQDTDPIQWRILSRAFAQGQHLLVMVGDPKQAIYRFRGGDLPTYLQAAASADAIHALDENRRSTPELIEALNRLMAPGLRRSGLPVPQVRACADRVGPDGAPVELLWLGQQEPPDSPSGIEPADPEPEHGSQASGRGGNAAPSHPSRTALERDLPAAIARYVQDLLQRGIRLGSAERRRPLLAEDICLLVSNHRQAELLRAALETLGIASRLVSKADVFQTPAATALQRYLDALAEPGDANRLRLLAASPLLAWSASRLAAATPSDWGELADRLSRQAAQLPQRGLLGVLAELLRAEGMARLALGGRLAADLQQLSELVQQRLHTARMAPAAAADWLRRRRLDPHRLLREEDQAHSDRADGAVSVITIHRSKGLQFPVVICPFLWQGASALASRSPARRWHPPGAEAPLLDLHRNLHWGDGYRAEQQRLQAEDSERERLAYVALTRAEHLLVLAWGPAQGQQSAPLLPWLLADHSLAQGDEDPIAQEPATVWRQRLEEEIARRRLPIAVLEAAALPAPTLGATPLPPAGEALGTGPVPQRRLGQGWGRWSYSAWIRGRTPHGDAALSAEAQEEGRDTGDATPEALLEITASTVDSSTVPSTAPSADAAPEDSARADEDAGPEAAAASLLDRIPREPGPLSRFPCGPMAGDCLHRILELLDFSQATTAEANRQPAERELQRSGFGAELLPALLEGLERVRTTPFGGELGGQRLADLPPGGWLSELRFDLSLGEVTAAGLAEAFRQGPATAFGGTYADRLVELPIASRGFLTGAIDLVLPLNAGGGEPRWWVLDWKSNWLGQRDEDGTPRGCGPHDYDQRAMEALMLASHYPLQAHLYLVALHRYLRWRLPRYEPAIHLGGFLYVFLRGTPGEIRGSDDGSASAALVLPPGSRVPGMVVERPPLERVLALDAALGGHAAAEGNR